MQNAHVALLAILTVSVSLGAEAQSDLRPAPSSHAISEVLLRPANAQPGDTTPPKSIRVDYGQPHLRGRKLHTDSLVPYDKLWRTGANDPTTLTTDVDLVVGGTTIPKGAYVLYTIPGRTAWSLILQKSVGQSTTDYNAASDVARISIRPQTSAAPVESLTMWLIPSTQPGAGRGELRLAWGTTVLSTEWSVK